MKRMAEKKVYVKIVFHMKVPARDLDEAMTKARHALLNGKVTFDPKKEDGEHIVAWDAEMSDDSGYVSEQVFEE